MSDTTGRPDEVDQDRDDKIDEGVEETFPASDPPAVGGSTGPNDGATAPAPRLP